MRRTKMLAGVISIFALLVPTLILAQTTVTMNGTVSSANGNMISFTANGTNYTVDTSKARLMRNGGATMQIGDIKPYDQIQVRGTVNGSTVTATSIQDMSLRGGATFTATVRSISGTSLVLRVANVGSVTVNTNSSTVITKNGQPASLSDIKVGDRVTVKGMWDTTTNTVTASSISL